MAVLHLGEEFLEERQNYQSGRQLIHFFDDFMNPAEAPAAKTRIFLSAIYKIRQASLTSDFHSKVNTALARRVGNAKTDDFSYGAVFFISSNRKKTKSTRNGRPQE